MSVFVCVCVWLCGSWALGLLGSWALGLLALDLDPAGPPLVARTRTKVLGTRASAVPVVLARLQLGFFFREAHRGSEVAFENRPAMAVYGVSWF